MKLIITITCVLVLGVLLVTAIPARYNQISTDQMPGPDINTDEIPTQYRDIKNDAMMAAQYMDIYTDQMATTQSLGSCVAACRRGTSAFQVCILYARYILYDIMYDRRAINNIIYS